METTLQLRERINKSQFELAIALKKTPGSVSGWERGTHFPVFTSLAEIKRVIVAYECSFAEFLAAFGQSQVKLPLSELNQLFQAGVSLEALLEKLE